MCLKVFRYKGDYKKVGLKKKLFYFSHVNIKGGSFTSRHGAQGHWSTDGCNLKTGNQTHSICECTHMTNFAILMSPYVEVSFTSKLTTNYP